MVGVTGTAGGLTSRPEPGDTGGGCGCSVAWRWNVSTERPKEKPEVLGARRPGVESYCIRPPPGSALPCQREEQRLCAADEPMEESFGTIVLRHVNIGIARGYHHERTVKSTTS